MLFHHNGTSLQYHCTLSTTLKAFSFNKTEIFDYFKYNKRLEFCLNIQAFYHMVCD